MRHLVSHVADRIRERRLFSAETHILVAVSGGLDSMVLLEILNQLAPAKRWRLAVVHFNHQLRGRSSDADERFVQKTAERLGLKCHLGRANVRKCAAARKISVEMAARELRHEFLAKTAATVRAKAVALAHHADDQVELFFLRLLRGSGTQGLAGMRWCAPSPADRRIRLARPLLDVSKSELLTFAHAAAIPFRADASNASSDYLRNRVRNELLPLLAKRYQPAIAKIVLRQMEILQAEDDFLNQSLADQRARKARANSFQNQHVALQRRWLQAQAIELGAPLDFEMIERLRLEPGMPFAVLPGLILARTPVGQLRKISPTTDSFSEAKQARKLRAGVSRGGFSGVKWTATIQPWKRRQLPKHREGCEWFDADRVGSNIVLRHWRQGDRFKPSGMSESSKLQDLFTNLKIPRSARRNLVVAATASGELWWVEGLRIAEVFKIRPETKRALKWEWLRTVPLSVAESEHRNDELSQADARLASD